MAATPQDAPLSWAEMTQSEPFAALSPEDQQLLHQRHLVAFPDDASALTPLPAEGALPVSPYIAGETPAGPFDIRMRLTQGDMLSAVPQQPPYSPSTPTLLGPTGQMFDAGNGAIATEKSITVEDGRLNQGKPTNIPLLVPGQPDLEGLAQGREPTREEVGHAISWAVQRGGFPGFATIEDAVAAAQKRSDTKGEILNGAQSPFLQRREFSGEETLLDRSPGAGGLDAPLGAIPQPPPQLSIPPSFVGPLPEQPSFFPYQHPLFRNQEQAAEQDANVIGPPPPEVSRGLLADILTFPQRAATGLTQTLGNVGQTGVDLLTAPTPEMARVAATGGLLTPEEFVQKPQIQGQSAARAKLKQPIEKVLKEVESFEQHHPKWFAPSKEEQASWVRKALVRGPESAVQSLAIGIPALMAGGFPALVLSGSTLFSMAEWQQAGKEIDAYNKTVPKDKQVPADITTQVKLLRALAEGGGEVVSTFVGGKILGLDNYFKGAGKEALTKVLTPSLQKILAQVGGVALSETLPEMGTAAAQAATNKLGGMPGPSPTEAALEAGPQALVASLIFAGVGLASQRPNQRRVYEALANPETDQTQRMEAAQSVSEAIKTETKNPDLARNFLEAAQATIQRKEPLPLDLTAQEAATQEQGKQREGLLGTLRGRGQQEQPTQQSEAPPQQEVAPEVTPPPAQEEQPNVAPPFIKPTPTAETPVPAPPPTVPEEEAPTTVSPKSMIFAVRDRNGQVYSDVTAKHHAEVLLNQGVDPDEVIDSGFIFRGEYKPGNPVWGKEGEIIDVIPSKPQPDGVPVLPGKGFEGVTDYEKGIVAEARQRTKQPSSKAPSAQPGITPETIHQLARENGVEFDAEKNPAFATWSEEITGESHLDKMSEGQLQTMKTALEQGKRPKDAQQISTSPHLLRFVKMRAQLLELPPKFCNLSSPKQRFLVKDVCLSILAGKMFRHLP